MSLRISLTAIRTASARQGRVRYQLGTRAVTVEQLVLCRWKARSREPRSVAEKVSFDGCRLPPGTWRLLREAQKRGLDLSKPVRSDDLQHYIETVKASCRDLRCPQVDKFAAMIEWLRLRKVLSLILIRDRPPESPGIPDLFLFRRDGAGNAFGAQFVEVKRRTLKPSWREKVSRAQIEEIAFLKGLGIKTSVAYVIETPASRGSR